MIKLYNENALSREELIQLCELYFEGELSRAEEKMLSLVLANTKETGGIIDEALFVMGIEKASSTAHERPTSTGVSSSSERIGNAFKKKWKRIAYSGIAAAIAMGGLWTIWKISGSSHESQPETLYTVFINGKEVKDPEEAIRYAQNSYSECMALIARMEQLEEQTMDRVDEKMNAYEETIHLAEKQIGDF